MCHCLRKLVCIVSTMRTGAIVHDSGIRYTPVGQPIGAHLVYFQESRSKYVNPHKRINEHMCIRWWIRWENPHRRQICPSQVVLSDRNTTSPVTLQSSVMVLLLRLWTLLCLLLVLKLMGGELESWWSLIVKISSIPVYFSTFRWTWILPGG